MAKSYSDDLRRRILEAYAQGEGTQAQVAQRFPVSVGNAEKIRGQQRRRGQMARVPYHPGRKPKFSELMREQLRSWVRQRPDCTLVELQEKTGTREKIAGESAGAVERAGQDGIAVEKSHSTRANGIRKPISSGKPFSKSSLGSPRKS